MKLSFCIPTFNRAKYLDELLENIARNIDYRRLSDIDIEIIISDNNSSDNTFDVILKYENILNIKKNKNDNNIGPCANLLKAASLATGDFIWFFSDDDALTDLSIFNLNRFLGKHSDIDYIFYPRVLVDKDLNHLSGVVQPKGLTEDLIFENGNNFFTSINGEIPAILGFFSSSIIKRNIWEKNIEKYSRKMTEWTHLEIILQSIHGGKCAVLRMPGILCRTGNSRAFFANSRVWFDDYVRCFILAKDIGYSSDLCDKYISEFGSVGQKLFVFDKMNGSRLGSFKSILKPLENCDKLITKNIWYWISFIPASILKVIYPVYVVKKYFTNKINGWLLKLPRFNRI